jgi:hypothetical protein
MKEEISLKMVPKLIHQAPKMGRTRAKRAVAQQWLGLSKSRTAMSLKMHYQMM